MIWQSELRQVSGNQEPPELFASRSESFDFHGIHSRKVGGIGRNGFAADQVRGGHRAVFHPAAPNKIARNRESRRY